MPRRLKQVIQGPHEYLENHDVLNLLCCISNIIDNFAHDDLLHLGCRALSRVDLIDSSVHMLPEITRLKGLLVHHLADKQCRSTPILYD